MRSEIEIERERYAQRLKGLRDYLTNIIGREEEYQAGLIEGFRESAIRTIGMVERIMNLAETPPEHLAGLTTEELRSLQEKLIDELANPVRAEVAG